MDGAAVAKSGSGKCCVGLRREFGQLEVATYSVGIGETAHWLVCITF
jgi:hypothetical protein